MANHLFLNFKLLYTRNNCSNSSQYFAIIPEGRGHLVTMDPSIGHFSLVSGLFIFWENSSALKLEQAQCILVLSVSLEGDSVSEIVTT